MVELLQTPKKIRTNMWTVKEIIDGKKLKVAPTWTWGGSTGDTVVINGYSLSSQSLPPTVVQSVAIERLKGLLLNQTIILSSPTKVEGGIIYCDVLLNSVNISSYFPDFHK